MTGPDHSRPESNCPHTAALATLALLCVLTVVALPGAGGASGVTAATAGDAPAPALQQEADLAVTATATDVADGNVTVEITLTNEGPERSDAPVVRLDSLPEGWEVVAQSSDGAAYRPSTNEWLWVSLAPDATVTVTTTISVPEDADRDRTLPVSAQDADGNAANTTVDVGDASGDDGLLGRSPLVLAAAGVAVVLLLGVGVVAWRRRGGGRGGGQPPEPSANDRQGASTTDPSDEDR